MKITVKVVKPKSKDLPFKPFASIIVTECAIDDEGRAVLSPKCVSDTELGYWCDKLIGQLQKIKKTKIG